MKYFTSYGNTAWEPCNASSLSRAKAVAMRRNPYIDKTGVCVGIERVANDGDVVIEKVAYYDFGGWLG